MSRADDIMKDPSIRKQLDQFFLGKAGKKYLDEAVEGVYIDDVFDYIFSTYLQKEVEKDLKSSEDFQKIKSELKEKIRREYNLLMMPEKIKELKKKYPEFIYTGSPKDNNKDRERIIKSQDVPKGITDDYIDELIKCSDRQGGDIPNKSVEGYKLFHETKSRIERTFFCIRVPDEGALCVAYGFHASDESGSAIYNIKWDPYNILPKEDGKPNIYVLKK